jgi:hypothetical protein
MKYIRNQIIVSKIFEGEIKDNETISSIFEQFKNSSSYLIIEYRDSLTKITKSYKNIKIKAVNGNKIDISIFTRSGTLNIKNINFDDVLLLEANISSQNQELNKQVSRFDLLDI